MLKVMLFMDGRWIYENTRTLRTISHDRDYKIDYEKLPKFLSTLVAKEAGIEQVDVVRRYLFGSYPANVHPDDKEAVDDQLKFYRLLGDLFHYEVELYPINFKGNRLRARDRMAAGSDFEPEEKCVDVALSSSMLYFAAVPYAYDYAIAVIGDRDYVPALQHVRRLGRRIAIASIQDKRKSPR